MAGEERIDHSSQNGHVTAAVNAIEQRNHSHGHGSGHGGSGNRVIVPAPKNSLTREDRKPRVPRQCRTCGGAYRQSCHVHAIRSFINAFCLSYGIRATVAIIFRGIQLFRKSPRSFFNIKELASGSPTIQEECFRLGMFTGSFVGGFNYVHCLLQKFFGKNPRNSLIAGGIAGLSVRFLAKDSQRTLSLYIVARLLQCLYNEAKRVGYFKPIPHGDALLFAISSAQVMYAYVMRPDSLPKSYLSFIQRTGPIDTSMLDAVRAHHRGTTLPLAAMTKYVNKVTPKSLLPSILPAIIAAPKRIGCNLLHPHTPACSTHVCFVFINAFKRTLPLYTSLTFAPIFVLRLMPLLRSPATHLGRGVFDTIRSTTFLATFVSTYQAVVCAQRNVFSGDHRILYWFAGLIASAAIFIEKQTRRSELALYVMPRAADSLYMQLRDHRVLTSIPGGEALLFMIGSAGLMYFHHDHNGRSMSPMMNSLFNLFFGYRRII